jgi:hypothetical protein
MMRSKFMFSRVVFLALMLSVPVATAQAGSIPIVSAPGLDWDSPLQLGVGTCDDFGCYGETVAINPHPVWQGNNPDGSEAVWISYANTGYGQTILAPVQGTDSLRRTVPVMTVVEQLSDVTAGSTLSLKVWADDTAFVYLGSVGGPFVELFGPSNHTPGQSS